MSDEPRDNTHDAQHDDTLRPADDDPGYDPRAQAAVTDALRYWSTSLTAEPLETPPPEVWDRINAALAHAELTGDAPRSRRLRALPGGRWTTPLVAASVVGLALVIGANLLGGSSDPAEDPALVAADAPAPQSAESSVQRTATETAVAASPQLVQAGFIPPARKVMELSEDLTSATVAQRVDEVLDSVGVVEPQDVLAMPTEEWTPSEGMTSDPQVLRECVTKVTKVPTSQALLVLRATVNGVEAGLIVVPEFMVDMTQMADMDEAKMSAMGADIGQTTIYVVEPTCGTEAPDQDPTLLEFSITLAP